MSSPGHVIRMMLQWGRRDLIAGVQPQSMGHEVDAFGGIPREDNLVGRRINERCHLLARPFAGRSGFFGEGMHAAVHV